MNSVKIGSDDEVAKKLLSHLGDGRSWREGRRRRVVGRTQFSELSIKKISGWVDENERAPSCTSSCRPTKKPHQLLASLKCGSPRRNKHQSVAIFAWLPLWLQSAAESTNRHPFWLSRTLPVKTKRNIIRALDDCTADRPVDCCD